MLGIFDFHGSEESFKNNEIINQKLNDKENPPSLEDLLDLEGLTSEFSHRNKKLIEFCTKEKIKQMLDYIIKEPKIDDYNKAHKFPFICSKIFDLDIYDMVKYFFMTRNELIEEKYKKNLDLREHDSSELTLRSHEDDFFNNDIDFQGYNLNEFNMDDNKNENENNIGDVNEEEKKDDKIEECNMNENKKDDEDDLVNHIDDEVNDKKEKEKDNIENDVENKKETEKQNEDKEKDKNENIEENKDKIEDNQDDIINYENNNIKDQEKADTKEEIPKENLNQDKTEEEKAEKPNKEKEDKKNTEDNNSNNSNEDIKDEYPEDRIEILDYFLSFLLTDSELNYVLCGYFSSLMSILLYRKGDKIIRYIYEKRKDILDKLLFHSYNISISELFFKFLIYGETSYGPIDKEDHPQEYKHIAEIKSELIKNLFDTIDINMNTEKLSSIFYNMKELINIPTIFKYIINNNYIINTLINKQLGKFNFSNNKDKNDMNIFDKKNNFVILCDIIILWLNYIKQYDLQIPMLLYEVNEDSDEDTVQQNSTSVPELHHTNLSQAFFDILP